MTSPDPDRTSRGRPALVSVVVPMHNARDTVGRQLEALAAQDYDGDWEVVLADNLSTDDTVAVAQGYADRLPGLRICRADEGKGSSYARNAGIAASRGDLLAFCDADDAADPGWLSHLVAAAAEADVVGGTQSGAYYDALGELQVKPRNRGSHVERQAFLGFLPFAAGNNVAAWRDVIDTVGAWDTRFLRGQDVDFSWRAQVAGFSFASAPRAVMNYHMRPTTSEGMRQHHAFGIYDAMLVSVYRSRGCPQTPWPVVGKKLAWLALHTVDLVGSRWRRLRYLKVLARSAGKLRGSLRYRVRVF